MSLVQQLRGGRDYDAAFGTRMRGTGVYADLIEKRFALACKRLGLNRDRGASASGAAQSTLDTSRFRPPRANTAQAELF
jgi:hypothetical protein